MSDLTVSNKILGRLGCLSPYQAGEPGMGLQWTPTDRRTAFQPDTPGVSKPGLSLVNTMTAVITYWVGQFAFLSTVLCRNFKDTICSASHGRDGDN